MNSLQIPPVHTELSEPAVKELPKIAEYTPPDKVYIDIQKHVNRIKNLEEVLDQNRSRGKNLSAECFNLLAAAEIVTFDLQIFDFILNPSNIQDPNNAIRVFVQECTNVASNPTASVETIAKHIRYVYQSMQCAVSNILASDINHSRVESTPEPLVQFVHEIIRQNERKFNEPFNEKQPEPKKLKLPVPDPNPLGKPLNVFGPQELEDQLSRLVIVDKVNEEVAHMRGILGALSHKVHEMEALKSDIADLKRNYTDPQKLSIQECPTESLDHSAFFQSAREMYSFLLRISKKIRAQATVVPQIIEAFHNAQDVLARTAEECKQTKEDIEKYHEIIRHKIAELHEDAAGMKQAVQPYLQALYPPKSGESTDPVDATNKAKWDEVSALFNKKLSSIEQGSEDYIALQSAIEMFDQLKDMRAPIIEKCIFSQQASKKWKQTQLAFFNAVADSTKAGVQIEELIEEKNQLAKMEKLYIDFNAKYANDTRIDQWCYSLQSAENEMIKALKNQNEAVSKMSKTSLEAEQEDIKEMEEELKSLEQEDLVLDDEYAALSVQISCEKENAFIKLQEREAYRDWMQDTRGKFNEYKFQKYKDMIICPICGENTREYIFLTCKHVICGKCLGTEHKCPICERPYKEDECVKLFFQK